MGQLDGQAWVLTRLLPFFSPPAFCPPPAVSPT